MTLKYVKKIKGAADKSGRKNVTCKVALISRYDVFLTCFMYLGSRADISKYLMVYSNWLSPGTRRDQDLNKEEWVAWF